MEAASAFYERPLTDPLTSAHLHLSASHLQQESAFDGSDSAQVSGAGGGSDSGTGSADVQDFLLLHNVTGSRMLRRLFLY